MLKRLCCRSRSYMTRVLLLKAELVNRPPRGLSRSCVENSNKTLSWHLLECSNDRLFQGNPFFLVMTTMSLIGRMKRLTFCRGWPVVAGWSFDFKVFFNSFSSAAEVNTSSPWWEMGNAKAGVRDTLF